MLVIKLRQESAVREVSAMGVSVSCKIGNVTGFIWLRLNNISKAE